MYYLCYARRMEKKLSKEAIEELRLILHDDYSVDALTDEELLEYGLSYLTLGKEILRTFKQKKRQEEEMKTSSDSDIL